MSVLDRFQLFVIVRRQVSDRELLRRYLAVEAAMEEMAQQLGEMPVESARMTGLGACVDAQLCRENPDRRGEVASEILRTEGAPREVCDAVLACRSAEPDTLTPLSAGLLVAEWVVDDVHEVMELEEGGLDDVSALVVTRRIARRAARPENAELQRLQQAALERLGLTLEEAVTATLNAMLRVRDDLRL